MASRRPFFAVRPNLAGITYALSDGLSNYHAFQFSAEKRLTHGLNFLASYTFGKSIDNVPTSFGGGADGPVPQNIRDRSADRGLSGFNIRHRFTYSTNYQLPFGKGKGYLNDNGVANAILGGWQMNGIATLQSGLPFTPTLASSTTDLGAGPIVWGTARLTIRVPPGGSTLLRSYSPLSFSMATRDATFWMGQAA